MENQLTKETVVNNLKSIFLASRSDFENQMRSGEKQLGVLLDLMGLPSEAEVKELVFSPEIVTRPMLLVSDYNMPAKEQINQPIEEIEVILGEYYPDEHKIVLYYNAIILDIAPIVYDIAKDESNHQINNCCRKCLSAAFSIVFAHEYFHAVHHQKGDFDNANLFLQESLARYFELLNCGICLYTGLYTRDYAIACLMKTTAEEYNRYYILFGNAFAERSRISLEQRPKNYAYKGALTFDKLLGTRLPAAVDGIGWLNEYWRNNLKNIITPRYEFLRELFYNSSSPKYKTLVDLHISYNN